jgi:hypothetical protein
MRSQLRDTDRMAVCALPSTRRLQLRRGPPRREVEARRIRSDEMSLMEMAREAVRQSDEAITEALTDPDLLDSDLKE